MVHAVEDPSQSPPTSVRCFAPPPSAAKSLREYVKREALEAGPDAMLLNSSSRSKTAPLAKDSGAGDIAPQKEDTKPADVLEKKRSFKWAGSIFRKNRSFTVHDGDDVKNLVKERRRVGPIPRSVTSDGFGAPKGTAPTSQDCAGTAEGNAVSLDDLALKDATALLGDGVAGTSPRKEAEDAAAAEDPLSGSFAKLIIGLPSLEESPQGQGDGPSEDEKEVDPAGLSLEGKEQVEAEGEVEEKGVDSLHVTTQLADSVSITSELDSVRSENSALVEKITATSAENLDLRREVEALKGSLEAARSAEARHVEQARREAAASAKEEAQRRVEELKRALQASHAEAEKLQEENLLLAAEVELARKENGEVQALWEQETAELKEQLCNAKLELAKAQAELQQKRAPKLVPRSMTEMFGDVWS